LRSDPMLAVALNKDEEKGEQRRREQEARSTVWS
jgi:hypothetical protein